MALNLADRVVLITGGTGALGRSVTRRFLREDSTVITTYLETEEFETVKQQFGDPDNLIGYKVDVTSEEQVDGLVDKVVENHGRIDVLLNLVGGWKGGKELHKVSEETWDSMFSLNLKSAFLVSRAVLPHMRANRFGRIISVGAKTGHDLPAEGGPYAIAKHGIESLTTILAKENEDYDITANCVLPSVIDTPANREMMGADNTDKWVQPEDVADKMVAIVMTAEQTGESVKLYGGYD